MPASSTPLPTRLVPPDFRSMPPEPVGGTGLATASLVLGIVSLVANLLLLPTLLAVILGIVALVKGTASRGRAIAGIVLGVAGVLVLALWAAIAIPVFLGAQAQAVDSGAKSVLANDRTALVGWAADHDGDLPSRIDPVALARYGWDDSPTVRGVTYSAGTGANDGLFCLVAVSRNGTSFVTTTNTSVAAGAACPEAW